MTSVFCINFKQSFEVLEFEYSEYKKELVYNNIECPLKLSDYDRIIFKTEDDAESFLKEYKTTKETLTQYKQRKTFNPCILLKRHYLVLTLMRYKTQTYRHYNKNWKIGQLFTFTDQTHYVDVKLTDLKYSDEHELFKYSYTICI